MIETDLKVHITKVGVGNGNECAITSLKDEQRERLTDEYLANVGLTDQILQQLGRHLG